MNCSLLKITYPALRTLLRVRLSEAVYQQVDNVVKKVSQSVDQNELDSRRIRLFLKSIQLKQVRNETATVTYQSAIALKLSSVLRMNSSELTYRILDEFQQKDVNFCQENLTKALCISSDFTGRVVSSGLLQFELSDRGLSTWLQYLMNPQIPHNSSNPIPLLTPLKPLVQNSDDSSQLFFCQHSHARCCSLLLTRESVIALSHLEGNALDDRWIVLTPTPVPWLTTQGQLCLIHPAEQALISQLVAVVDDLSNLMTASQSCLKSAFALSHSFQNFYKACQISDSSPSSLQRSQSRLGLVMATQRLLRHLLEVGLGVEAPFEL